MGVIKNSSFSYLGQSGSHSLLLLTGNMLMKRDIKCIAFYGYRSLIVTGAAAKIQSSWRFIAGSDINFSFGDEGAGKIQYNGTCNIGRKCISVDTCSAG